MKKLYIFIFTMIFVFSANAQFSGDYAPSNWSLTGVSANSDASVDASGAPNTIIFNGNNSDFGDFDDLYDDYSITVTTTGYLSFSYDWVNSDSDSYEEFYYVVNGVQTLISNGTATGNVNAIPVTAGEVFAFRIFTGDDCCGGGVASISSFMYDSTLSVAEDILSSSEFNFYATAVGGIYAIDYSQKNTFEALNVFNALGKLVKKINFKDGSNRDVLDLTNLSSGLYIISIETSKGRINKKIVI
ncbi:T9SS type A sorting domain-containing protein [Olleya marilimosa]|jgi:hypothetical protein|uniref:T9SS type A sorting domain-containing protein n=1 Tax=Olleya marilimosa TaxID=272164 RepID=A0ABR8LWK0_9FLAO|nr:T9SS type A sorting domain-containing protein [Olleya marilimosa]MBD3863339.1 T9SS type A sorting domain-containing protein [Olleya marilimosa]MBD3890817.1 T9SS type A sorting domain-containing protein [Olleya marilimosa]